MRISQQASKFHSLVLVLRLNAVKTRHDFSVALVLIDLGISSSAQRIPILDRNAARILRWCSTALVTAYNGIPMPLSSVRERGEPQFTSVD